MQLRRFCIAIFSAILFAMPQIVMAEISSTAAQEQALVNEQNIMSGNQTITFPASKGMRGFSVPGNNPLPSMLPTPSHFAPPITDGNFGSIYGLLPYKNQYTMDDAESLLQRKGRNIRVLTTSFLADNPAVPSERLRIIPDPAEKQAFAQNFEIIGIGNYRSADTDIVSEHVLGMAVREGLNMGADIMLFQEGAALIQEARGISIGFFNSFSYANTPGGDGIGNVAASGIGWGKGQTGYASKPWLRVQYFRQIANSGTLPENSGLSRQIPDKDNFEEQLESLEEPTYQEKMMGTQP